MSEALTPCPPALDAAGTGPIAHIVLAGGCFWCIEAAMQRLRGVVSAVSGYAQGHLDHPSYAEVCTGTSGHAEAVRVGYDPQLIAVEDLLQVLFTVHDPTTPNRQGADVGPQYRSGIYVETAAELEPVRRWVAARQPDYAAPIVTEVELLRRFWPAEAEHQGYMDRHPLHGYCQLVIAPKLAKLEHSLGPLLQR